MCDFRAIFHLDWDTQLWTGDPHTTEQLFSGLLKYPESLFRASFLRDNPPSATGESPSLTLDWHGLDQTTNILANLYNVVVSHWTNQPTLYSLAHPVVDPIAEFWGPDFPFLKGDT